MADNSMEFINPEGLRTYTKEVRKLIKSEDNNTLNSAKSYTDEAIRNAGINENINNALDSIRESLNTKVNTADGMGLSSNDFTDDYKNQIDSNTSFIDTKAVTNEDISKALNERLEDYVTKEEYETFRNTSITFKGTLSDISDLEQYVSTANNGDAYYIESNQSTYIFQDGQFVNMGSIINLANYVDKITLKDELAKKSDGLRYHDGKLYLTSKVNGEIKEITEGINVSQVTTEDLAAKADNLYYDTSDNKLYLTSKDSTNPHNIIGDGVVVSQTGGGGGSGGGNYQYSVNFRSLMPSRVITASRNDSIILKLSYSSSDSDGNNDGTGIGTITVGSIKKAVIDIHQGDFELDVTDYVAVGSNDLTIRVVNSEGTARSLNFEITVISLSISTTLYELGMYTGVVDFLYTVNGIGTKTVHFFMDGDEIDSVQINSTGISQLYSIPEQQFGGHTFKCYATLDSNGVELKSNEISLGMLWTNSTNAIPSITTSVSNDFNVTQGEIISIPYLAYNLNLDTTTVTLSVIDENNITYSTKTISVNRSAQVWTIQDYPAGRVEFKLSCGDIGISRKSIYANVTPLNIDVDKTTTGLQLEFNPEGRSNNDISPAPNEWSYNNKYNAIFNNFIFGDSDGWLVDSNNVDILRFLPGDTMTIPYKLFSTDIRSTGLTIEAEFATSEVRSDSTPVLECYANEKGIRLTTQRGTLRSSSTSLSILYKEDTRVRVTFTVEGRSQNRMIYVYVDGILSGAIQYAADNDSFTQDDTVGLTIGSGDCGLDLYKLRIYNRSLSRREQLNNFINDTSLISEKESIYKRNNIFNSDGQIDVNKLPIDLPYMIFKSNRLSTGKKDEVIAESVVYVDNYNPSNSFTATNMGMKVQGTSSASYPIKNYKFEFKNGFDYSDGTHSDTYKLSENSIPVSLFCMKADFASSENANNVKLVDFYEQNCTYKTPPQRLDSRVRQGVEGIPILIFWECTDPSNERDYGNITLLGKYNFNNDKSTQEVFGFGKVLDDDGNELGDFTDSSICLEFLNNTSNRSLFRIENPSIGTAPTSAWLDDFEFRYPDDKTLNDGTSPEYAGKMGAWKRVVDWVSSTTRFNMDSNLTAQSKLNKFKAEFENYFVKEPVLFYYIYTEMFLMVDSRAKNLFATTYTYDAEHPENTRWLFIPYDMDTAIGINNEGIYQFDYGFEANDTVDLNNNPNILVQSNYPNLHYYDPDSYNFVFNACNSTLWNNIRDAFADEIESMYRSLRSNDKFNYNYLKNLFLGHQKKWPEAVWNEDAFSKWLKAFIDGIWNPEADNGEGGKGAYEKSNYLSMVQGDKKSQRDWWLYNAFRYRDSKYMCKDAEDNKIYFRIYSLGNYRDTEHYKKLTLTSYQDLYLYFNIGSARFQKRALKDVPTTFNIDLDSASDTDSNVYSADRISDLGYLAHLNIGSNDFSKAYKIKNLILGDTIYTNDRLQELNLSNSRLLENLSIVNCVAFKTSLDLSKCISLKKFDARGSKIPSVSFSESGRLEEIYLPNTINTLSFSGQKKIRNLVLEGYDNIRSININNSIVPGLENLLLNCDNLNRVRLYDVEWTASNEANLMRLVNKLASIGGLDQDGNPIDTPQVLGKVVISSTNISSSQEQLIRNVGDLLPDLVVAIDGIAKFTITYWDSLNLDEPLASELVLEGHNVVNPVGRLFDAPIYESTIDTSYRFTGFGDLPTNVRKNMNLYSTYQGTVRVRIYIKDQNGDYKLYGDPQYVATGEDARLPLVDAPSYSTVDKVYKFRNWDKNGRYITGPTDIYAIYSETPRTYTVKYYNGGEFIGEVQAEYGTKARYPFPDPTDPSNFKFDKDGTPWLPSNEYITGDTVCYAQFISGYEYKDIGDYSWSQIKDLINSNTYNDYLNVGNFKRIQLADGSIVEAQIAAMGLDDTPEGGKVPITWVVDGFRTSKEINKKDADSGHDPVSQPIQTIYPQTMFEKSMGQYETSRLTALSESSISSSKDYGCFYAFGKYYFYDASSRLFRTSDFNNYEMVNFPARPNNFNYQYLEDSHTLIIYSGSNIYESTDGENFISYPISIKGSFIRLYQANGIVTMVTSKAYYDRIGSGLGAGNWQRVELFGDDDVIYDTIYANNTYYLLLGGYLYLSSNRSENGWNIILSDSIGSISNTDKLYYIGDKLVINSEGSLLLRYSSGDMSTWSNYRFRPNSSQFPNVYIVNNMLMVTYYGRNESNEPNKYHINYTTNLTSWSHSTIDDSLNKIHDVVTFGGSKYIVYSSPGRIHVSSDLRNWELKLDGIITNKIESVHDKIFSLGDSALGILNEDLTMTYSSVGETFVSIIHDGEKFLGFSSSGYYTSVDGINWSAKTSLKDVVNNAYYLDNTYFYLSTQYIHRSQDAITWTDELLSNINYSWTYLVKLDDYYYAIDKSRHISYTRGRTWSQMKWDDNPLGPISFSSEPIKLGEYIYTLSNGSIRRTHDFTNYDTVLSISGVGFNSMKVYNDNLLLLSTKVIAIYDPESNSISNISTNNVFGSIAVSNDKLYISSSSSTPMARMYRYNLIESDSYWVTPLGNKAQELFSINTRISITPKSNGSVKFTRYYNSSKISESVYINEGIFADANLTDTGTYEKSFNVTSGEELIIELSQTSSEVTTYQLNPSYFSIESDIDYDIEVTPADYEYREVTSYREGTGSVGGYRMSSLKEFIDSTVYNSFPEDLRNVMIRAKKYTAEGNTSAGSDMNKGINRESSELLCPPSVMELTGNRYTVSPEHEIEGGYYYRGIFNDDKGRIRRNSNSAPISYNTRTSYTTNESGYTKMSNYAYVTNEGKLDQGTADTSRVLVLEFFT